VLNFHEADDFDAGVTQLLQRVVAVTGPVATSDTGNTCISIASIAWHLVFIHM